MARRRRTGTTRQRWDCLAAERRPSGVKIFREVSGKKLAIFLVGMEEFLSPSLVMLRERAGLFLAVHESSG